MRERREGWHHEGGEATLVTRPAVEPGSPADEGAVDVYTLVLPRLKAYCERPRAERDIKAAFVLEASQLKKWLKLAVAGKHLRKLSRPVRYQTERTMFD